MYNKKLLITGSEGFIAKNFIWQVFFQFQGVRLFLYNRKTTQDELEKSISDCDIICHFAGVNRSEKSEFAYGNEDLTDLICRLAEKHGGRDMIFSSSIHAGKDTEYGQSKRKCEDIIYRYQKNTGKRVHVIRLPGVYGKWSKPDYNSVVATFCHRIANGLDVYVNNTTVPLKLLYIDDLIDALTLFIFGNSQNIEFDHLCDHVKLSDLAQLIRGFHLGPREAFSALDELSLPLKLVKHLHATYVSFLDDNSLVQIMKNHKDARGIFCEIMRDLHFGQLSFATIAPGEVRGGHFHHTKVELFLIVSGNVIFEQESILDKRRFKFYLKADYPSSIYSKPGCIHTLTNQSDKEAIILIWTNESFDAVNPDTYYLLEN